MRELQSQLADADRYFGVRVVRMWAGGSFTNAHILAIHTSHCSMACCNPCSSTRRAIVRSLTRPVPPALCCRRAKQAEASASGLERRLREAEGRAADAERASKDEAHRLEDTATRVKAAEVSTVE